MTSASQYISAPLKLPSADAWGYLSTATTTAVVEHSGVSTTFSRLGTGRYGVTFSSSSPFSSGAYVVLATPEISHDTNVETVMCRIASTSGSTALGRSAGFEFNTFSYNSSQQPVLFNTGVTVGIAAFSFSRDRSAYSPRVGNLIRWSQNFDQWIVPALAQNSSTVFSPTGDYTSFALTRGPSSSSLYYTNSLAGPVIDSNKHYTSTVYAKAGNTGSIRVALGTLGSISTYDVYINLYGTAGSSNLTSRTGSVYTAALLPVSTGVVEGTSNVYDVGNGWRKIDITIKPNANGNTRSLYLYLEPAPAGVSGQFIYVWGAQITEGSIPVPYIKTEATAPVYGDDSPRFSTVHGSSGYGITGATYNSQLTSLNSRRSATAYGTVVIPNRRALGVSAGAYLENTFNVRGVSAGNTQSVFDITFEKPLNNTRYCVILAGEYESDQNTVVTSSITSTNEFSNLLVRAGANNRFKTTSGFRIESRKQAADNSWTLQPTALANPNGLTERIHFMVFGGGTYGQA